MFEIIWTCLNHGIIKILKSPTNHIPWSKVPMLGIVLQKKEDDTCPVSTSNITRTSRMNSQSGFHGDIKFHFICPIIHIIFAFHMLQTGFPKFWAFPSQPYAKYYKVIVGVQSLWFCTKPSNWNTVWLGSNGQGTRGPASSSSRCAPQRSVPAITGKRQRRPLLGTT